MFIGISREKGLRQDFGVTFIETFIKLSSGIRNWLQRTWCIVKMRYIDWKYYEDLKNIVFNSVIEK
jgi:hypothetical protein